MKTHSQKQDFIMETIAELPLGTKVSFTGEKAAASGAGTYATMVFYIIGPGSIFGKNGLYLSKKRPKDEYDASHMYVPEYRLDLGAILPANVSFNRPNAMTLGYIDSVNVL